MSMLNSESVAVPDHIKIWYPFTRTNKTVVHNEIVTMLMHDATSGKSFENIGSLIATYRLHEYAVHRAYYTAAMSFFYQNCSSLFSSTDENDPILFSSMEDPEGYNQVLQPSDNFLLEFFNIYTESKEGDMEIINDTTLPGDNISIDVTYSTCKKTKKIVTIEGEGPYSDQTNYNSIGKKGLLIAMSSTGQNLYCARIDNSESVGDMEKCLRSIKERCARLNVPLPTYYTVDNVDTWDKTVKKEMGPEKITLQDIKHIIDRFLDNCSKGNPLYSEFSRAVHGAFAMTNGDTPILSRDGTYYKCKAPLRESKAICDELDSIVKLFKRRCDENRSCMVKLFKKEFDHCFNNQKEVIMTNVKEIYINGSHAYETETGVFRVYRGNFRIIIYCMLKYTA